MDKRIRVLAIALIFIVLASGVVVVSLGYRIRQTVYRVSEDIVPRITALQDAEANATRLREESFSAALLLILGTPEPQELREELQEIAEAGEATLTSLEAYGRLATTASERRIVDSLTRALGNMSQAAETLLAAARAADPAAIEVARGSLEDLEEELLVTLVAARSLEEGHLSEAYARADSSLRLSNLTKGITVLLAVLLILLSAYYISRYMTDPGELAAELRAQNVALADSIAERDLLIQEVHHRVKNNLQLVDSLLRLQLSSVDDLAATEVLQSARSRLFALSSIHEQLHAEDHRRTIDSQGYFNDLARRVEEIAAQTSKGVLIQTRIDPIGLTSKAASSLGLIVNELLLNAVKHGLAPNRQSEIALLISAGTEEVVATVRDNGNGLPEGFEPGSEGSLGMQLVWSLTAQLSGRIETENNEGAVIRVIIPRTSVEARPAG